GLHPRLPPFPYTTLFRSTSPDAGGVDRVGDEGGSPDACAPAAVVRGSGAPRRRRGAGRGARHAADERGGGPRASDAGDPPARPLDRKSTRLNSSHVAISY